MKQQMHKMEEHLRSIIDELKFHHSEV